MGDIGNVVLRDRKHLSQYGFIVCIVAIDEHEGEVIYGSEIISRGFIYMREQEELIKRPGSRQQGAQEEVPRLRYGEQDQGLARQLRRPRARASPHDFAGRG